jgi:Mg2+ and Co2+ transporter CorA
VPDHDSRELGGFMAPHTAGDGVREIRQGWFHTDALSLMGSSSELRDRFTPEQVEHARRWLDTGRRSRMEFRKDADYVLGLFLVPVLDRDGDAVWMRTLLVLATRDTVLTVDHTPTGRPALDPTHVAARLDASSDHDAGTLVYLIVDDIAWAFTRLAEGFEAEVNEVEDRLDSEQACDGDQGDAVRHRLKNFRSDLHDVRSTLVPTEEAVHYIISGTDLDGAELFPPAIEERLKDTYDRLRYVSESLDVVRDELGGLRDYLQARIANEQNRISIRQNEISIEQNDIMKALTIVAALVLIPTFVVGFYGQNFEQLPGRRGGVGFWSVSALMVMIVLAELWYLWRRGWIGHKKSKASDHAETAPQRSSSQKLVKATSRDNSSTAPAIPRASIGAQSS